MPAAATVQAAVRGFLSDRRPGEVFVRISKVPQRSCSQCPRPLLSKPLPRVWGDSAQAGAVQKLARMLPRTQATC